MVIGFSGFAEYRARIGYPSVVIWETDSEKNTYPRVDLSQIWTISIIRITRVLDPVMGMSTANTAPKRHVLVG